GGCAGHDRFGGARGDHACGRTDARERRALARPAREGEDRARIDGVQTLRIGAERHAVGGARQREPRWELGTTLDRVTLAHATEHLTGQLLPPTGSSAVTRVPAPGRESSVNVPPRPRTRSRMPTTPR